MTKLYIRHPDDPTKVVVREVTDNTHDIFAILNQITNLKREKVQLLERLEEAYRRDKGKVQDEMLNLDGQVEDLIVSLTKEDLDRYKAQHSANFENFQVMFNGILIRHN